jgi:hypothetical protein
VRDLVVLRRWWWWLGVELMMLLFERSLLPLLLLSNDVNSVLQLCLCAASRLQRTEVLLGEASRSPTVV